MIEPVLMCCMEVSISGPTAEPGGTLGAGSLRDTTRAESDGYPTVPPKLG